MRHSFRTVAILCSLAAAVALGDFMATAAPPDSATPDSELTDAASNEVAPTAEAGPNSAGKADVPVKKSRKKRPMAAGEAPASNAPTTVVEPPAAVAAPPAVAAARTVTVYCLSYARYRDGSGAVGFCSPVHITAGGRSGNQVRVGFLESDIEATGHMWQSAGWSAAITAAQLTDFNPRCLQVLFDYEGKVDGPSAGALMTIGVLAAALGHTPREDMAMTGTINPDGTIGPVGGIPYKIAGAAREGKKMVLIPAGSRFEKDLEGNEVDLIKHGRDLGVEVRPVVDIYTAYKLFTGEDLLRAPPAESPLASEALDDAVRLRSLAWRRRYKTAFDDMKQRPTTARTPDVLDFFSRGIKLIETSESLLNEGQFAVGYWDSVEGTALAYIGAELAKNIQAYQHGGNKAMVARVRDNEWLKEKGRETAQRLRNETPKTMDQLSAYLFACTAFYEGLSLQATASVELSDVPEDPSDDYDDLVMGASGHQIIAWLDFLLTDEQLDLMAECGGPPIPAGAPIDEMATFYLRGGEANNAVFESIVVEKQAEAAAVSIDRQRLALLLADDDYAVLYGLRKAVIPNLSTFMGDGEALPFARLAAGIYVFPHSAALVAKYYSLGAELDEDATIVRVGAERTFHDWLDRADDQSRRSVGFLQARGLEMNPCSLSHQISRVRRNRDLHDKFTAWNDFLCIHVHSEALRRLAGYKLDDPAP